MCAELVRDALLREIEDDLLGAVDEVGRLAGPLPAEPLRSRRRRGSGRAASPISRTIRA